MSPMRCGAPGWRLTGLRVLAGGLGMLVAPAGAVGALGVLLAVVPFGRGTLLVSGRLDLVTFLLAGATSLALVEPAGGIADATPTGRLRRRSSRVAVATGAAAAALLAVRIAAPPSPGVGSGAGALAELLAQIALVAAVGAVAGRWHPEPAAAAGAAAVGVLAGAGPKFARLDEWSADAHGLGPHRLALLALGALLAFAWASRDPAAA